jgi:hypothetical protein
MIVKGFFLMEEKHVIRVQFFQDLLRAGPDGAALG